MKQILIISNGIEKAVEFAKDRKWKRCAWKYINDVRKLRKFKEHTTVLAYDYEKVRNSDKIIDLSKTYGLKLVNESYSIKKTKIELTLLTVAHSSLLHIKQQYDTGINICEPTQKALDKISKIISEWKYEEELHSEISCNKWIINKTNEWDKLLIEVGLDKSWSILFLIHIASSALTDVFEICNEGDKNKIENVLDEIYSMSDFLDEKGDNFATYNYADYLLCELKEDLGIEFLFDN